MNYHQYKSKLELKQGSGGKLLAWEAPLTAPLQPREHEKTLRNDFVTFLSRIAKPKASRITGFGSDFVTVSQRLQGGSPPEIRAGRSLPVCTTEASSGAATEAGVTPGVPQRVALEGWQEGMQTQRSEAYQDANSRRPHCQPSSLRTLVARYTPVQVWWARFDSEAGDFFKDIPV